MAAWHMLVFDNHQHRPFQKNYSKLYHSQVTFLLKLFEKGLFLIGKSDEQICFVRHCLHLSVELCNWDLQTYKITLSGLKHSWWLFIHSVLGEQLCQFQTKYWYTYTILSFQIRNWCLNFQTFSDFHAKYHTDLVIFHIVSKTRNKKENSHTSGGSGYFTALKLERPTSWRYL